MKSADRRKRCVRGSPRGARFNGLGAQAGPALRATGFDDGAPADGTHARPKSVGALSFQHAWLVSTFHVKFSRFRFAPTGPYGARNVTFFRPPLSIAPSIDSRRAGPLTLERGEVKR